MLVCNGPGELATWVRPLAQRLHRELRLRPLTPEGPLRLDLVLVPELRRCRTICVANKQTHDCIYFSGVDVDQLAWFLRHLRYPSEVIGFVEANRAQLDHLLFDVGFDYRMEDGGLRVLKSGYYGVF